MAEQDQLNDRLARDESDFAKYSPDDIYEMTERDATHHFNLQFLNKIDAYQIASVERDLRVVTAERILRQRVDDTREEPSAYEEHADAVEASRRITHLVDESLNELIDESSDNQHTEGSR